MNISDLTVNQIVMFLLVFVRISGIFTLFPLFGSSDIPVQARLGFAFLTSIVIFPIVPVIDIIIPNVFYFFYFALKELVIGLVIGFAGSILFAAVTFAGNLIDLQLGFGFVQAADPLTNISTSVVGQFMVIIFTIIFLMFNGHYFLLIILQKSFEIIPLNGVDVHTGELARFFTALGANIFSWAFKLAAPVFTVLVLISVSISIIARTVPQLNIFFVALPLKIGIGLAVFAIVLPLMLYVFKSILNLIINDIYRLLYIIA